LSVVERIRARSIVWWRPTLYEGYISTHTARRRSRTGALDLRWRPSACMSEASGGTEPWTTQTECLLRITNATSVRARVRFLQLVARTVRQARSTELDARQRTLLDGSRTSRSAGGGNQPPRWEEATEVAIECGTHTVASLLEREVVVEQTFPAHEDVNPSWMSRADRRVSQRERQAISAEVTVQAELAGADLVRVLSGCATPVRSRSMAIVTASVRCAPRWWSTHGDPRCGARRVALARRSAGRCCGRSLICRNVGLWPVLVGEPGESDTRARFTDHSRGPSAGAPNRRAISSMPPRSTKSSASGSWPSPMMRKPRCALLTHARGRCWIAPKRSRATT